MITRPIPKTAKSWLREKIEGIASENPPISALKYIPYERGAHSYVIPKHPEPAHETCESGLAIPPRDLWCGYGHTTQEHLSEGHGQINKMLELVNTSRFSFVKDNHILDFGCAAGRLIRHLKSLSDICEIWGTDISAPHICWAKQYLSPPFHFAVTTTIPHLPFEDRYFQLIYCGSVFTHIDDLAEAWLCELRRVLSPNGRLYLTISDRHSIDSFDGAYREESFAKHMRANDYLQRFKDNFGMLVIGRDTGSHVFYDVEYFCKTLSSLVFHVLSVTPEAYGYQTAVLIERKGS